MFSYRLKHYDSWMSYISSDSGSNNCGIHVSLLKENDLLRANSTSEEKGHSFLCQCLSTQLAGLNPIFELFAIPNQLIYKRVSPSHQTVTSAPQTMPVNGWCCWERLRQSLYVSRERSSLNSTHWYVATFICAIFGLCSAFNVILSSAPEKLFSGFYVPLAYEAVKH